MKLTILLLITAIMQISAAGFAQKITLERQNAKLELIFNDIREQTGYDFFYSTKLLNKGKRVSFALKDADLKTVLDECFKGQPFSYELQAHAVIVVPKRDAIAKSLIVSTKLIDISGAVLDETGQPLAGASVKVKGTDFSTVTDKNGQFRFNKIDDGAILVISFIGYGTVERKAESDIKIILIPATNNLQEVKIVMGYGSAIASRDVVGTLSMVSSKDVQDRPIANGLDALQGRVAGLNVLSSSGEPTAIPSIYLRGAGSINSGNGPLIVIDGVPVEPRTLVSLNANDFETFTVLKDAAATSIYGSRAANGVILITTKHGLANESASINFTSQYGISQLANSVYFENFMNRSSLSKFLVEFGTQTQSSMDAVLNTYKADTKWHEVFYKNNTPTYQNNIQFSRGAGGTTYFISAGYFKQEGLAYNSQYERFTLRANIATQINKWIKLGLNAYGSYDTRQSFPYTGPSLDGGLSVLLAPWFPSKDDNGNNLQIIPGAFRTHPEYEANAAPAQSNNTGITPSAYLTLTPLKGFTLRAQAGIDGYDLRSTYYQLPSYIFSPNNGFVQEGFTRGLSKTFTNTAEYKFSIANNNNFTLLLGQEYTDGQTKNILASAGGFTDDRLLLLNNGPRNRFVNSTNAEYSYYSLFARADYNWKSKYYLEASVREDRSSKFGINNKSGLFYSVGASWKAKQEKFFQNVNWLNDLILRVSTGTSGNSSINAEIGNYAALATVGPTVYAQQIGFNLATPGYPDLTWEKQQLTNIGLSATFFNRIFLETSYYVRTTKDMLLTVPYAGTTGFSAQIQNTGSLQNKGLDIELSVDLISRDNPHRAYLRPRLIANFNKSRIISLFQDRNYWVQGNQLWAVGQPITYFQPIWAGVDSNTGLPSWYNTDPNPDNLILKTTNNGTTNTFSSNLSQNTGVQVAPKGSGSFGLSTGYEGLSLDVLFTYVMGKYIYNTDSYYVQNPTVFLNYNQQPDILDYWKAPGDVTRFPKKGQQFTQFDSRLVQDASFMRLKDITLGYALPKITLDRMKVIKHLSVFFTGRNLLTITGYNGTDPELDVAAALGNNPNTKQYLAGVKIGF